MRLASYERAGKWAAAVAVSGGQLVDAGAATQRAGLAANGVGWTSVRALLAEPAGLQLAGAPIWLPDLFNGVALAVAVGLARWRRRPTRAARRSGHSREVAGPERR